VIARTGTVTEIALEDDSHPGCIVAADVALDAVTVTAVSIYGRQERSRLVDDEPYGLSYSVTAIHRMLSDLTALIDSRTRRARSVPLVLGGDLNVSTQVTGPDRERHAGALRRFAELGLTDAWLESPDKEPAPDCDCTVAPDCGHVRTHRHNRSARPWQLDHLFANRALRLTSCRTAIDTATWDLSDHAPVIAVYEL
jgi:endonuclease/exonuclease/phosphatase family metal-dependent hydrolase